MVATPIGHLKDISQRAAEVLAAADVVAAEDTRRTRQLLTHLGLHKRLISVRGHNEARQIELVEQVLDSGQDVAMASDAGTPLISDPGEKLVSALAEHGYDVVSVPGPCAAIVALTVSGLPADRFTFVGFLPRTAGRADDALAGLVTTPGTLIFYESPRRLEALLERLLRHFGDRRAVLCRELTKLHEEVVRGTIATLIERARQGTRGEIVVLVEGAAAVRASQGIDEEAVAEKLRAGVRPRDVAREVAGRTGLSSRAAYAKVLAIQKRRQPEDRSASRRAPAHPPLENGAGRQR
ncbi:MAG: 16S rRNA (cytidine(1402)-2'-O)-methyltransferase [Deltaproteobacteria bacterium]|nr:16S rRNA (cytidine(1402)-2'-O)-methyltransferase [Deltaproteobacteria bacterium]